MQNQQNVTAFLTILFIIILVVVLAEKFIPKSPKLFPTIPAKTTNSSQQSQPFAVPKVSNTEKKQLLRGKVNQDSKSLSKANDLDLTKSPADKITERSENDFERSEEVKNPTCIVQLNQRDMQDYIVRDFIERYECSTKE